MRIISLYLLKIAHVITVLVVAFGPFFIRFRPLLYLLIAFNIFTVSGWYILGYCFVTPIEEWLEGKEKTESNTETKSFISIWLERFFPFIDESCIRYCFSIMPAISTFVSLFVLYKMDKIEEKANLHLELDNIDEIL